ncbi:MAG: dCTP deaminase domain-containing protein [Bryobacteraceae bacterium]
MMMTDEQIRAAVDAKEILLDPFDPDRVEPASYDVRIGNRAFASSSKDIVNLSERGVLIIEPGEFAVLESRERIELDRSTAAQLGLRSEYARRGLLMLSGPQIDPGFGGILVVRVVNLAPKRVALPYEAPFLTVQFFRLSRPSQKAYSGPQQHQTGITAKDIQELTETEGLTLGQVMKTLSALATDVAELKGSVGRLAWLIPLVVCIGMAVIGAVVAIK